MKSLLSIHLIGVTLGIWAVSGGQLHSQTVLGQSQITTKNLNNVQFCEQFSGADAGAKITACVAALSAAGGTADARGFQGAQSAAATITVPAYVTLLLDNVTLTSSATPATSVATGSNGASGRLSESTTRRS